MLFSVLREDWAGETPQGAKRRGGSPDRPRKAKFLECKSTANIFTAIFQNIGGFKKCIRYL
ncbi:hypothetical protein BTR25_14480 [Bacillus sp. MRMR6]|nr:hypothetical protein BTR25_14480 [Bacillus sp. MRMR6]